MTNKPTFDDIMNQFNSEDEDHNVNDILEDERKILKHQSDTNLIDNINSNIRDKLSNNINNKKKYRKDKFGYFINNKEKEENEHSSNSEENSNNYYGKLNSENENSDNNEYNEIENKNINNVNNINNNENSLKYKENNKYVEKYTYEEKEEKNNLNNKSKSNDNQNDDELKSLEDDDEYRMDRMDSFRPKPMPDSPKFIDNKKNNDIEERRNENENENKIGNNDNTTNFTETLKTKIEGDKNSSKIKPINEKDNNYYTHESNIISLGKMTNKDNENNNYNKNEENERKDFEDSDKQEEEDFLMREELKRKNLKEKLEQEKKQFDNSEDDGRENIIDDDEEEKENAQMEYIRNLEEKRKKLKKYQEEIKSKNNININNNNNNIINNNIKKDDNKVKEIKIKDMSIKLLHNYINGEDKKDKNEKINNNNDINNNDSNNNDINKNDINNKNDLNKNSSNKKYNNKNQSKSKSKSKSKYSFTYKKNNKKFIKKNQNPNIKKTEINNKFASPSTKNTNHINNDIISTRTKKQYISSFNINSNKIGNNKGKNTNKTHTKKCIDKIDLNILKKRLYSSKKQTKPTIKKQKTNPCFKSPPRPRPKKAIDYHEKYSYTPIINKNSKKAWEKRNTNLKKKINLEKNNSEYNKDKDQDNTNTNYKKNKKINIPIGVLLYEDGNSKKEKMRQICLTEDENIKSTANIPKINKNSMNMVIDRTNKKINNIVNKYSVNEKLSIVKIVRCFSDLKIINELIKSNQNNNDLKIEKLKAIVDNIKNKDQKKIEELEFIEQIWFKINPSMKEYIDNKIFLELLKILFLSNDNDINNINNINQLTTLIENLLEQYNIYNNNDSSNIEISSPLRDKNYEINELWDIPKLVKIFLKLKSDIKAYKNNDYENKHIELKKNLLKEKEKELTFEPDTSKSNYIFDKNSKYNYYNNDKDVSNKNYNNYSKKGKYDFNKIYERFMNEKKNHEETLEKLREIKKRKELKKCTYKPNINQNSHDKMNKTLDYEDSKILNKRKKIPIYERLYNLNKLNSGTKSRNSKIEESNYGESRTTEDKINRKKNLKKNNLEKDKYKDKKNDSNPNNAEKKEKNCNDNIIDNIYITIDIKIPNGELKPLKIYQNKNNKSNIDSINEFCNKYNIKKQDRKAILDKVNQYKKIFFGKNEIEEENNDFIINEDMDTNTNTFGDGSKNSNESIKKLNSKNYEKMNIITDNNISYENNNNKEDNKLKTLNDYISYKK